MRKSTMLFITLILFLGQSTHAQTLLGGSPKKEVFYNDTCENSNSCDLIAFSVSIHPYTIIEGGLAVPGMHVLAAYETSQVETLEKYGIVQFMRGCRFESSQNAYGTISKFRGHLKEQFGSIKIFEFKSWVLDSTDKDALFSSNEGANRFGHYRWSDDWDYEQKNQGFYGDKKQNLPRLYVLDDPPQAYFSDGVAHNVSLQFRTCTYRTEDVPRTTNENDVSFATPIHCFEWNHIVVYNHRQKAFEAKTEMDPSCK